MRRSSLKRSGIWITQFYTANTPYLHLPRKRLPDGATTSDSSHLTACSLLVICENLYSPLMVDNKIKTYIVSHSSHAVLNSVLKLYIIRNFHLWIPLPHTVCQCFSVPPPVTPVTEGQDTLLQTTRVSRLLNDILITIPNKIAKLYHAIASSIKVTGQRTTLSDIIIATDFVLFVFAFHANITHNMDANHSAMYTQQTYTVTHIGLSMTDKSGIVWLCSSASKLGITGLHTMSTSTKLDDIENESVRSYDIYTFTT